MISPRFLVLFLLLSLAVQAPTLQAAPATKEPATALPARRAGYFIGRAVKPDGTPLPKVRVRLFGTTDAGQRSSLNARTDANGLVSVRLPSGNYSVQDAVYDVKYRGRPYRLPLYLVGEDNSDFDSQQGGVATFILKTQGLIADSKDRDDENAYFGGWFTLDPRNSDGGIAYGFEDASRAFVVTLKPQGALLDGKQGKTLTFTKPLSAGREHRVIRDIPLGVYSVSVSLKNADGTLTPLLISSRENIGSAFGTEPALVAPLTFAPKEGDPVLLATNGVMNANLKIFLKPPATKETSTIDNTPAAPNADDTPAAPNAPADPEVSESPDQMRYKVGDRVEVKDLLGRWSAGVVISALEPPIGPPSYEVRHGDGSIVLTYPRYMRRVSK